MAQKNGHKYLFKWNKFTNYLEEQENNVASGNKNLNYSLLNKMA